MDHKLSQPVPAPEVEIQPTPEQSLYEMFEQAPPASPQEAAATTVSEVEQNAASPDLRAARLPKAETEPASWKAIAIFSALISAAVVADLALKARGKPEIGGHLGAALGDMGTGSSHASVKRIQERVDREKAEAAKDTRTWWQKIPAFEHFGRRRKAPVTEPTLNEAK